MSRLTDAEVLQLQMAALDCEVVGGGEYVSPIGILVAPEYSEHSLTDLDDPYCCQRCYVVDEQAMRDALRAAEARHAALVAAVETLANTYAQDDADHLSQFGQHHPVAYSAGRHLNALLTEHGRAEA